MKYNPIEEEIKWEERKTSKGSTAQVAFRKNRLLYFSSCIKGACDD